MNNYYYQNYLADYRPIDYAAWLIILLTIFFFIFAIYWQVKDFQKIESLPNGSDFATCEEKLTFAQFCASYNYLHGVTWRPVYVSGFIASIFIIFVLAVLKVKTTAVMFLAILLVILVVFYIMAQFYNYHLNRTLYLKSIGETHGWPDWQLTTINTQQ